MSRLFLALFGLGALTVTPVRAQDPAQAPPVQEKTPEQTVRWYEEVVVISASKTETTVIDAPATMSVVSADTIASSPAQNYGDLLRSTPGLNVIQTSARDINMTSRQGTSTLASSQLVLLDGRSLYLDFFGLVLWDFVPQSMSEIKQIEVVRGPASAVWGANALTGVINIITKPPRDAEGFNLNLQGGRFNRSKGSREDEGAGYLYGANFSFAQAPSERLSWRLSASYFNSDPFSRPKGRVPFDCHPLGVSPCRDTEGNARAGGYPVGGAAYPADKPDTMDAFENDGTSQPKVDFRVDQALGESGRGGRLTYQGGYSGTTGIIHTGIGPFRMESGSRLSYGKVQWNRNAMRFGVFGNFTHVKAPNLLLTQPNTGEPVALNLRTQTYDVEFSNSTALGRKQLLTYGGNYRRNNFDVTLTPNSRDRNEFGAYVQEEFFTDRFRLAVGLRADKFGNIHEWVFSPRISLMYKPTARHSIRASFNRAFRSPFVLNNYLDQDFVAATPIDLRPFGAVAPTLQPLIPPEPVFLVVKGRGSEVVSPVYPLKQESLEACELAYTGRVGRTTFGLALYLSRQDDSINFANLQPSADFPEGLPGLSYYSSRNPAKVVGMSGRQYTMSPILMDALLQIPPAFGGPIRLPETVFSYLNLGPIQNKGVEVSLEHHFTDVITGFANYSYQATPKVLDPARDHTVYPTDEVGIPAKNRVNLGLNWNSRRYLGSASLNYSDKAFWNDVLTAPYHGFTDSYALVNASFGIKWAGSKVITVIKGTNLTNETIQQHVYGDILKISVAFEVRIYTK